MTLIFKHTKIILQTNNMHFIVFFYLEIHNCNIFNGTSLHFIIYLAEYSILKLYFFRN